MDYIFISYSSKDKNYVRSLKDELLRRRFNVWVDEQSIRSGGHWMDELEQAVIDCAALVVVMTPNSRDPNSWVHNEIATARAHRKPIHPLLLAGERFFSLSSIQEVNVTDGRLPPKYFYDALAADVSSYNAAHRTSSGATPTDAKPAHPLSPPFSLAVEYQNFRGERKTFAVDPKTIRIPEGRGYPSRKHLSMCVAPTGTRIALNRHKILNLSEVERVLARRY